MGKSAGEVQLTGGVKITPWGYLPQYRLHESQFGRGWRVGGQSRHLAIPAIIPKFQ